MIIGFVVGIILLAVYLQHRLKILPEIVTIKSVPTENAENGSVTSGNM